MIHFRRLDSHHLDPHPLIPKILTRVPLPPRHERQVRLDDHRICFSFISFLFSTCPGFARASVTRATRLLPNRAAALRRRRREVYYSAREGRKMRDRARVCVVCVIYVVCVRDSESGCKREMSSRSTIYNLRNSAPAIRERSMNTRFSLSVRE